jgi:hypothetical protein
LWNFIDLDVMVVNFYVNSIFDPIENDYIYLWNVGNFAHFYTVQQPNKWINIFLVCNCPNVVDRFVS